VLHPLLKKNGLDASQIENYMAMSNLQFLSKLLERIVQSRLHAFLDGNDPMPTTLSAFRQFHSTETAITKVYNGLLLAADEDQVSAPCLLDLTAAFDTVGRLERQFGLRVLRWFGFYLSDRSFRVVHCGATSSAVFIVCFVPQGSLSIRPAFIYTLHGRPCSEE